MQPTENLKECLQPNDANFVALSPLSFVVRSRDLYPNHASIIYGKRQYTWQQTYTRCVKLSNALIKKGLKQGDTVSVIAANTPEMIELHYAIPMSGGVINTINFRLDVATIAYILNHADTRFLITDSQFSKVVKQALQQVTRDIVVIDIVDDQLSADAEQGECLGALTYENLLAEGDADYAFRPPQSEWQALALNYTSGTSGFPKGVVYHHRGSYLMSMGTIAAWPVEKHARYLYTVPLFHCNGWGHAWTMAAVTGTMYCCRSIAAQEIFSIIEQYNITHFGAAPIVLNMLAEESALHQVQFSHKIKVMTAGAPPPSSTLEKADKLGFDITHVYGLTETYGHVIFCDWQRKWDALSISDQAELKARQGVRFPMTEMVRVVNPETQVAVPHDGETLGEIQIRGNTMMKGYYKDAEATQKAFVNGWFHTEDLAVVYADGYIQVKDRLKDIIISGGENISSIEVESVIYKHADVIAAAVVAKPDVKWGESPCAFIELRENAKVTEPELIEFCRQYLAGFKIPKTIVFKVLPKTATGKIQKYLLRQEAQALAKTG